MLQPGTTAMASRRTVTNRLGLYLRTIRFLKPSQIIHLVQQRLRGMRHRRPLLGAAVQGRQEFRLTTPIAARTLGALSLSEFAFLNVTKRFAGDRPDWASLDLPKLWRYNLHYFDYLSPRARPLENKAALVADWIAKNPLGQGDGWEPYTASLRIVNWIKWFAEPEVRGAVDQGWLSNLYQQAAWLERNIEYHLLANHYLKNGKALLFAGSFFAGKDAERWLKRGLRILVEEAREQILADGGHFERSPMYHAIVVEDYLDVLNLLRNNPGTAGEKEFGEIEAATRRALVFLQHMTMPDGDFALFNDAAFRIAPRPEQLFQYAHALFGYESLPTETTDLELQSLVPSGYFMIRDEISKMIIDCGSVGPDYQPGHAHCDTLSYEFALNGRRVIVDSGVHDYQASPLRHYVRCTAAHNTVRIDGEEQSEIWGVFRVACRARPLYARLERVDDQTARFVGAHDGYRRLAGQPLHEREIRYQRAGGWQIIDRVTGSGAHRVESFVHLHPDFKWVRHEAVYEIRDGAGVHIASLIVDHDAVSVRVESGSYCPEFGKKVVNEVLVLTREAGLPVEITYRLTPCIPEAMDGRD